VPPLSSALWLVMATSTWVLPACDKSGPLADLDASGPSVPTAASSAPAPVPVTDAAPADAGRVMPPRPVPATSPTVTVTMPLETQLKAIQYMAAMQAPQPGDAPADADYAKQIANQLRGLGSTEVIAGGRTVEVKVANGCDATLPKEAIARSTGATLGTLLANGMLVVQCSDHQLRCLQSTRDATDVLCVHR
jgi:hypothetical protein